MYTEKSVELKSDFYIRYGRAAGKLYFESTGVPCVVLRSGGDCIAFALRCGVRAYGRQYGDIIKIMNSERNEVDIHFTESGRGAQILYKKDLKSLNGIDETAEYTVNKLMVRMGLGGRTQDRESVISLCDRLGRDGWCAYREQGIEQQLPLPIGDYNILIIRTQKNGRLRGERALAAQFCDEERKRMRAAAEGLKRCRAEVLFEMVNESERSIERLMNPPERALAAVRAAMSADGVAAARLCDLGAVCFTEKNKTDSAMKQISTEYERSTGFSAGIIAGI